MSAQPQRGPDDGSLTSQLRDLPGQAGPASGGNGPPADTGPGAEQDGPDPPPDWLRDPLRSDAKAAEAASEMALKKFCWAGGLRWRQYDPGLGTWKAVPEEAVIEQVRRWVLATVTAILKRALKATAEGRDQDAAYNQKLAIEWHRLGSTSRLTGIAKLARGIRHVPSERFDTHPDLLNTPSKVLNLRTGKQKEHDPDLYLTQVTGVDYDPDAEHEDVTKALEAIPDDVRPYAQLRYGQAITGYKPPDDVIDVQHGSGENGKTTILSAIKNALGDYAEVLPTKLLFLDPGAHSTELMTLRGVRMGIIEELPEEHQLSVAAIKIATAPRITARYTYKDNVTFANCCALVISANYRLQIRETDRGTWRRLEGSILFPYTYLKPHEEPRDEWDRPGDPTLRERISTDRGKRAQVMLAWLVEGAKRWYAGERSADGKSWVREPMTMGQPPQAVREDLAQWRTSCDLAYGFMTEHLVWDERCHVMSEDLLAEFNNWIRGRGHRPWSAELLTARFTAHSEIREHKVLKTRLRSGQQSGLSRPPGYPTDGLPGQYSAWAGMRFRTIQDEENPSWAGCAGPVQTSYRAGADGKVSTGPAHPAQDHRGGPADEEFAGYYEMVRKRLQGRGG